MKICVSNRYKQGLIINNFLKEPNKNLLRYMHKAICGENKKCTEKSQINKNGDFDLKIHIKDSVRDIENIINFTKEEMYSINKESEIKLKYNRIYDDQTDLFNVLFLYIYNF